MGNTSSNDELKLLEEIGKGSYAVVYRAVWRNKHVAAKKLHPFVLRKPEAIKYCEDWKLLSKLDHPNVVQYLTVVLPEDSPKSNESTILVTELLDQDLKRFIEKSKRNVSFRDTVSIMLDVAQGLSYLHDSPRFIVHRDLACKNILLTADRRAKIADFGLARCFPCGEMAASANPGTLAYRAPETFGKYFFSSRKITYGPKADVFSFGVVMLEVIVGHPSIRISELRTEDGEIVPECYRRSEDLHEIDVEHPLRLIVLRCLENNPEDRPTARELAEELTNHKNNNDFLQTQGCHRGKHIVHRMPESKFDYEFKVVLVGDTGVGKTSIATKFVQPNLPCQDRRPPTFCYGEFNERLQLKGKSVFLKIVDTSGQFDTASSLPQYYRGTHGAVVVFDVTSWDSLVNVRTWVAMVREKCSRDMPIILVGNKTDCGARQVNTETAENVRDEFDLFYIEVSAKTGVNIDETFSVLTEQLMQRRDLQTSSGASSVASVVCQLPSKSALRDSPSSVASVVCQLPSTSALRDYEAPAKFTIKEPSSRRRIQRDPDSVSLVATTEDGNREKATKYSSTAYNKKQRKYWCCS